MKKICKLGTVDEAIQSLEDQMPYFLQHVYVKSQQSAFFDAKKANLTQSKALVQALKTILENIKMTYKVLTGTKKTNYPFY